MGKNRDARSQEKMTYGEAIEKLDDLWDRIEQMIGTASDDKVAALMRKALAHYDKILTELDKLDKPEA